MNRLCELIGSPNGGVFLMLLVIPAVCDACASPLLSQQFAMRVRRAYYHSSLRCVCVALGIPAVCDACVLIVELPEAHKLLFVRILNFRQFVYITKDRFC